MSTGRIARAFIAGIADSEEAEAVAVASRDGPRAKETAREFGLPRAYGSYADLLADPDVDAVYIGLPNGFHAEWTIAAAEAGKHVLCEKPLAMSAAEARDMFEAARRHGVWLMEAFMYRFHPRTLALQALIEEGAIGKVRLIRASFGFPLVGSEDVRLIPELGGGALMDVGCYCVNFARMVAGSSPATVTASARWTPSGVDETLAGILEYDDGVLAQFSCSIATSFHQTAQVIGTDGAIEVDHAFSPPRDRPSRLMVSGGSRGGLEEVREFDPVHQLRIEAEGFARLVARGHGSTGLPEMPLVETLDNMATIEALLRSARTGAPDRV